MNRKQFLETVEAAPIAETGSRYAPNPNLLKIFDDAKSKERGGYTVKVRLLPADINSSIQRIPESAYHTWGTGKTFRKVRCTGDKYRCPVCRENWEHHVAADEHDKDVSMMRVDRYTNCYVISNPADPTSDGKVKILKMPAFVFQLYVQATTGDRKEEFGAHSVYSLDADGVTLCIKVQTTNNRTSYEGSYFQSAFASKKDVEGLTEEQKDAIWGQAFDLKKELAEELKEPNADEIIDYYVSQYSIPRNIVPLTEAVKKVFEAKNANNGVSAPTEEEKEAIAPVTPAAPAEPPAVTKEAVEAATKEANSDIDDILA